MEAGRQYGANVTRRQDKFEIGGGALRRLKKYCKMILTSRAEGVTSRKFCRVMRSANGAFRKSRRRHTPHSGSELSETADEASHTDNGIGDGDAASRDVVHREDESGGGEGEEAAVKYRISRLDKQTRQMLTEGRGCR